MRRLEERAMNTLSQLVEYVFEHNDGPLKGLAYRELAARIDWRTKKGTGFGRGMGPVLSKMGQTLRSLHGYWGERIPLIQTIAVSGTGSNAGLPGEGMDEFWEDYKDLLRVEKEKRVRDEYSKIVAFGSRWNDVLTRLGLPMVQVAGLRTTENRDVKRIVTRDTQDLEELFPATGKKFIEGRQKMVAHLQKERNEALVKEAKAGRPWLCEVCGLNFETKYGVPYVEAHHKEPLHEATSERLSTLEDIALVCANCHRAVHKWMARRDKVPFNQIKAMIQRKMAEARG